jgi:hypothetical protein
MVALFGTSAVIAIGFWIAFSSGGAPARYEYGHPFLQGFELGASAGHPDRQLFTKGSDLFLSSIYLWSDSNRPVILKSAGLIAGTCTIKAIEDKVATLDPRRGSTSSYIPFGYGSIHVWGWELSVVGGHRFAPREHGSSFLAFSFSDPKNCAVRLRYVDIAYSSKSGSGIERLKLGGGEYIPTNQRGYYGIDFPG